ARARLPIRTCHSSWVLGSLVGAGRRTPRSSVARADELEVAPHVEAIAGRDLVLLDHLFGDRLIVGENLLVAAAHEAALRRRVDDLARGRAFAGVGGRGRDVLRAALQLRRFTLQVRVVAAAVLLAALAGALPGLVPFLTR